MSLHYHLPLEPLSNPNSSIDECNPGPPPNYCVLIWPVTFQSYSGVVVPWLVVERKACVMDKNNQIGHF